MASPTKLPNRPQGATVNRTLPASAAPPSRKVASGPPKPQGKAAPPKPQGKAAPPKPQGKAAPGAPQTASRPAPQAASRAPSSPAPRPPQTASRPAPISPRAPVSPPQGASYPGQRGSAPAGEDRFEQEQEQPPLERPTPQAASRPAPRAASRPAAPAIHRPSAQEVVQYTRLSGVTDGVKFDQLPEFMREDIGKGTENIGAEDMGIVQYKMMQALSPELTERDDLRAGDFLHTGTGDNLGPSFTVVFLHFQKQYILWNPRESGGGILARAPDGKHWDPPNTEFQVVLDAKDGGHAVTWRTAKTVLQSGLYAWGTSNPLDSRSPPAATLMHSYLGIPWENPDLGPAILSFQRTSLSTGRDLVRRLKTVRGPMYGTIYRISSFDARNANNQVYKNMRAEGAGFVEDQALYDQFKSLSESFAKTGFDIREVDGMQDENLAPADNYDQANDGDNYDQAGDADGNRFDERGAPAY